MNAKLMKLLSVGEAETVEFKESFNDEAIEALGAFMNANGGELKSYIKSQKALLMLKTFIHKLNVE